MNRIYFEILFAWFFFSFSCCSNIIFSSERYNFQYFFLSFFSIEIFFYFLFASLNRHEVNPNYWDGYSLDAMPLFLKNFFFFFIVLTGDAILTCYVLSIFIPKVSKHLHCERKHQKNRKKTNTEFILIHEHTACVVCIRWCKVWSVDNAKKGRMTIVFRFTYSTQSRLKTVPYYMRKILTTITNDNNILLHTNWRRIFFFSGTLNAVTEWETTVLIEYEIEI